MQTIYVTSGETVIETDRGPVTRQLNDQAAYGTLHQALAANRRVLDYYIKNYGVIETNTASDMQWSATFRDGPKIGTLNLYIKKLDI